VTSLTVWIGAVASFGVVLGIVSKSVASANLPDSLREQMRKLDAVDFTTPSGYIGLVPLLRSGHRSFLLRAAGNRARGGIGSAPGDVVRSAGKPDPLAGRFVLAAGSSTLIAVAAGTGAGIGTAATGATSRSSA
jgi:hypothetical protein